MKLLSYWPLMFAPLLVLGFEYLTPGQEISSAATIPVGVAAISGESIPGRLPALPAVESTPSAADGSESALVSAVLTESQVEALRPDLFDAIGRLEAALLDGDEWTADAEFDRIRLLLAAEPQLVREVLALLASWEDMVIPLRNRLVRLLHQSGDPAVRAELRRIVDEMESRSEQEIPQDVVEVLARLEASAAPSQLLEAIEKLPGALVADRHVQARLREIVLTCRDDAVRCTALYRLASHPSDETDDLLARILGEESEGPLRLAAARALSESRSPLAAEIEMRLLLDPTEPSPVRSFAAIGLSRHPSYRGASDALDRAFWSEPSERVRTAALRSLIELSRLDSDARRSVESILEEADDPAMREMAVRGLQGLLPRDHARAALERALAREQAESVRQAILVALDGVN